ncbi:MAG: hypothetical protein U0105_20115 [Candidatus Obscuribacterales bacterium]
MVFDSGRYMRKMLLATFGLAATAYGTTSGAGAQQLPPAAAGSVGSLSIAGGALPVTADSAVPMRAGSQFQAPPLVGPSSILPTSQTGDLVAADAPSQPSSLNQTTQQIDLAPVRLPERGNAYGNFQSFRTSVLYKLPAKMYFDVNVENSLRLETNVFNTLRRNRADMVYRINPNVTVGYALNRKTRVAANYFFLRDQYDINNKLMSRNYQSVGFRADRDFYINPRTSATASLFARELFVPAYRQVSDILPSLSVVRRVGNRGALYSNVLGQIRWRDVFGRYQEFDQFYSLGGVYRTPKWTFLMDTTLVNSFGKRAVRLGPNNSVIVMTMEAGRRIHPMVPITLFARAEPIFNIGANQAPGFAGFNFRMYGGIRAEISKPAIFPVKLKNLK